MYIKTKMRYHLTPVRMATNNKSAEDVEKGDPAALLVGKQIGALWKAVWRYLKKFKMNLPYDPANSLLGIYLKEPKTLI